MSLEPVVPISAIEHFAYCPRQCALIHCDGVWSDNAHTVRGTRAHRRVDSGKHRRERGRLVLRGIPLWSEVLGLSGRADAVEIADDDAIRPVEYKAGVRHGQTADLQLCAQALCLEEMLNVEIPYGHVWYGGPRRRLRVDFTTALRDEVCGIVGEIRKQLLTGQLPAAVDDERCNAGPPGSQNRFDVEGVAGVSAPAFVERSGASCRTTRPPGVAGVSAPAFVERPRSGVLAPGSTVCSRGFSPGLR